MRPPDKSLLHTPCSAILLDGRLVRSTVSIDDPSCRLIRPLIGKLISRIRRTMFRHRSETLSWVRRAWHPD